MNSKRSVGGAIILALSLNLLSCDPGVDVERVNPDELVSITSFISPHDTILRVYLYRASELNTILDVKSSVVQDALVTISDGLNIDTLHLNPDQAVYESETEHIGITPNTTYFLAVTIGDMPTISAQCTVPVAPDTPLVTGNPEGNDYVFEISWQNPSLHLYHVATAKASGKFEVTTSSGTRVFNLSAQLDMIHPVRDPSPVGKSTGKIYFANLSDSAGVTAEVWNLDYNMYEFYDTWLDYDSWLNNISGGLPNLTSPTPVFSNVQNGTGVFGAFNKNNAAFRIK